MGVLIGEIARKISNWEALQYIFRTFSWFSPPTQYVGGSNAESHDWLILTKVENRTFLGKKFGIYRIVKPGSTPDNIWIRMKDAPKRCFMPYWIYRWVVCFAVSKILKIFTFFVELEFSFWTLTCVKNISHLSTVNITRSNLIDSTVIFWLKVDGHRWKNSFHSPCDFQTGFLSDDFLCIFKNHEMKIKFSK